ncbi:MAG: hypothetical protein JZU53_17565 [Paludibacter sp.]|nr:hypothetical protein [Paludibacter sp.]
MSTQNGDFENMEEIWTSNLKKRIKQTSLKQVIFLSGISNANDLSRHLASRKKVETLLSDSNFALTTTKAAIIVGSGSVSFEIISDLIKKLPFMIASRWLKYNMNP